MERALRGKYVTISTVGEIAKAFVPAPLPPKPDIDWTAELRQQFEKAHLALGRLDSISSLLPDTDSFLGETSKATYNNALRPTAEFTTRTSRKSVHVTRQTAQKSTETTEYSSEVSKKTLRLSNEKVIQPSAKASDKTAQATYQRVTKPSSEFTTKVSRQTGEVTARSAEQTYEKALKPTGEFSIKSSEKSSDVTARSSAETGELARRSADASTRTAKASGKTSKQSSGVMDVTLEATIRLTWKDYQTRLLDPDTADQLIKQAYAVPRGLKNPREDFVTMAEHFILPPQSTLEESIKCRTPRKFAFAIGWFQCPLNPGWDFVNYSMRMSKHLFLN